MSSFSASSTKASPKALLQLGFAPAFLIGVPVILSKGDIPWNGVGLSSAGLYPFPFWVITWTKIGPLICFTFSRVFSRSNMLCPSIVPTYVKPSSSNITPGANKPLIYSSSFLAIFAPDSPNIVLSISFNFCLGFWKTWLVIILLKYVYIAPTLGEIDIWLSFRITINLEGSSHPAWFKPSKASPAVIAPSPIIATVYPSSFFRSFATLIPKAADIEVELWPAPKWS